MLEEVFSLASLNLQLLPQSLVIHEGAEYGLARDKGCPYLMILSDRRDAGLTTFSGDLSEPGGKILLRAPLNAHNAVALRARLPWLQPRPLGLRTSAGLGDRLGLATPGHVRALRSAGGNIAPIFAQQSMREMARTERIPQQVMDDATWGIFQENWQAGCGADADHLKTPTDIDVCLAAGFTFFTIDPGAYVDARAETASPGDLREQIEKLPLELQTGFASLLGKTLRIEHLSLSFDETTLLRAMVKYGQAVWHVIRMYRHLEGSAGGRPFELEVSIDETERPISHAEHAYIASELKRLGVRWVSLAPRFVGAFEKGVDYIGDLAALDADMAGHAAIARHFGPYKLSLHSGSDKFSVYPCAVCHTRGLVHLKTAGTSYLEALRTIAALDQDLFSEIYAFACQHFETDRASYHVSARLQRAPEPDQVSNWSALLDQFDARQVLHVTFGSVLTEKTADGRKRFRERIFNLLLAHPEAYAANLEKHFLRHLAPFASQ